MTDLPDKQTPVGYDPIHPEGLYACEGCGRTYPEYINGCVEDHGAPRKVVLIVPDTAWEKAWAADASQYYNDPSEHFCYRNCGRRGVGFDDMANVVCADALRTGRCEQVIG